MVPHLESTRESSGFVQLKQPKRNRKDPSKPSSKSFFIMKVKPQMMDPLVMEPQMMDPLVMEPPVPLPFPSVFCS